MAVAERPEPQGFWQRSCISPLGRNPCLWLVVERPGLSSARTRTKGSGLYGGQIVEESEAGTPNPCHPLMAEYAWAKASEKRPSPAILRNGGVGERLKPAVLKNKTAIQLTDIDSTKSLCQLSVSFVPVFWVSFVFRQFARSSVTIPSQSPF